MTLHKDTKIYNAAYFETGKRFGISLYEDYRWTPEMTIPMACRLKAMYPKQSFLDFGCAKGFMVRALRILGCEAYGYDISQYALDCADHETRWFLFDELCNAPPADVAFAKDTFEHLEKAELCEALTVLRKKCREGFFIVPLGDRGKYRIREYAFDLTHRIAEDEDWWTRNFKLAGWRVLNVCHTVAGFKDKWAARPKGNGFFFLA